MEKRVYIPLWLALKQAREAYGYPKDYGICACYNVENMGWCKDEVTRWYHFTSVDGMSAYTLKRWIKHFNNKKKGKQYECDLVWNILWKMWGKQLEITIRQIGLKNETKFSLEM